MGVAPRMPGGKGAEILWRNQNPSSAFNAQSINIPGLDRYKYVAIIVGTDRISEVYNNGTFMISTSNSKVNHMYGTTAYNICSRDVSLTGDSATFSNGLIYPSYSGSEYSVNNSVMVPFCIVGVV